MRRSLAHCEGGTSTVELAISLPIFLLAIMGVLETGRALWTRAALQNGTEMAARCAAIGASSCSSSALTQSYASSQTNGLNPGASTFAVTDKTCGKEVSASYAYTSVVSKLVPFTFTLSAKSCYPVTTF